MGCNVEITWYKDVRAYAEKIERERASGQKNDYERRDSYSNRYSDSKKYSRRRTRSRSPSRSAVSISSEEGPKKKKRRRRSSSSSSDSSNDERSRRRHRSRSGQTGAEAKEKCKAVDERISDIVGKEFVDGLPEDDSIQALERIERQANDREEAPLSNQGVFNPPLPSEYRHMTAQTSPSAIDQAKIRNLDAQTTMFLAQARLFDAQADRTKSGNMRF